MRPRCLTVNPEVLAHLARVLWVPIEVGDQVVVLPTFACLRRASGGPPGAMSLERLELRRLDRCRESTTTPD